MQLNTLSTWVLAIRPRTLIASISPVLIGSSIALKKGVFSPHIFFLTLLFAILIQTGTNLANDYFDYLKGADTEKRKGPLRVMQMNLVSKKTMQLAIFFVFSLCILLGAVMAFIGGYVFFILASFAAILGIFYTAGPLALAYLGLGDVFVLVFFGPIATAGCNYLYTNEIDPICLLAGLGPGFFSCAILSANNIRDIEEDKLAQKKTLAVRFGKKMAICEYIFCVIFALLTPIILFYYGYTSKITFANIALFLLLIEPVKNLISNIDKQIVCALPQTAHVMTLYTLIFPLSILM